MISGIYILHSANLELEHVKSEILLHRMFYDDLPEPEIVVGMFDEVYKSQVSHQRTPVFFHNGLNFVYYRAQNDVLLVVVTFSNIDVMLVVLFLSNFTELLKFYLCKKDPLLDKNVILDNVYFVFELLDECMDSGVIQMTDYNILKEYIKMIPSKPKVDNSDSDSEDETETTQKDSKKAKKKKDIQDIRSTHNQAVKAEELMIEESHVNSSILRASSLAINWRPKGISYAKNELYIDVIENCEFFYDLQEDVILQNEVYGNCFVKCYLLGMPKCTIGFNETRISKLENDSIINADRSGNQLGAQADDDEDEDDKQSRKRHIPFKSIQFHQCVELDTLYNQNLMRFIPPDDKFVLISYNVEQQRQRRKLSLFMIKPTYRINIEASKLQVLCVLSTTFKKRLHGKNLSIRIPINPLLFHVQIDNVEESLKYKTEIGYVNFKVDTSELVWELKEFPGNNESIKMMAEISLADSHELSLESIQHLLQNRQQHSQGLEDEDDTEEAKRELDRYYGVNGTKSSLLEEIQKNLSKIKSFNQIKLSYNIPMLSYTGLKLNYLKVEENDLKYTCFPWVRYVTQSDRLDSSLLTSTSKSNCSYRFKLGIKCFEIV